MPRAPHRPVLPAVHVGLAGLATTGLLLTAPAAAQGQGVPTHSSIDSPRTAPASPAPRLTARHRAHLRAERREHRRVVHRRHKIQHAYRVATHQLGDPYVWGATGPGAFDCSGLTSYAYHHAGMSLPRTAAEQAGFVRHIPRDRMRRGDFVFFSDGGHVFHVGLYVGRRHGRPIMLNAPHTGASVEKERIWGDGWFAGTLRLR